MHIYVPKQLLRKWVWDPLLGLLMRPRHSSLLFSPAPVLALVLLDAGFDLLRLTNRVFLGHFCSFLGGSFHRNFLDRDRLRLLLLLGLVTVTVPMPVIVFMVMLF